MSCEHEDGFRHDCAYVAWRESKIPEAVARADAEHPHPGDRAGDGDVRAWSKRWDAAFHRAMAHLTGDPFTARKAVS